MICKICRKESLQHYAFTETGATVTYCTTCTHMHTTAKADDNTPYALVVRLMHVLGLTPERALACATSIDAAYKLAMEHGATFFQFVKTNGFWDAHVGYTSQMMMRRGKGNDWQTALCETVLEHKRQPKTALVKFSKGVGYVPA